MQWGYSPVMWAAKERFLEGVKALVQRGAKLDLQTPLKQTIWDLNCTLQVSRGKYAIKCACMYVRVCVSIHARLLARAVINVAYAAHKKGIVRIKQNALIL